MQSPVRNLRVAASQLTEEEQEVFLTCLKQHNPIFGGFKWGLLAAGFTHLTQIYAKHPPSKVITLSSALIGFYFGKIMCIMKCYKAVIDMPSSKLRERMWLDEKRSLMSEDEKAAIQSAPLKVDEQAEPEIVCDIPEYQPIDSYDGFHSINGSSEFEIADSASVTEEMPPQRKITYEELRKRHRESDRNRQDQLRKASPSEAAPERSSPVSPDTTKYDVWN